MWAVVIVTRRVNELQMALLVAILGAVYGAERLNALGAAHWREFATQDYFDERGVFVALLYCALARSPPMTRPPNGTHTKATQAAERRTALLGSTVAW